LEQIHRFCENIGPNLKASVIANFNFNLKSVYARFMIILLINHLLLLILICLDLSKQILIFHEVTL
jgi:hypothetical protein